MTHAQSIATPALWHRVPWCTLLLSAATAALSIHAALEISGTWPGKARIVQLENYGLRFEYLLELELWRLFTAQFVHVKQLHMLGNVFCLLWLGAAVERNLGCMRVLVLWLVGGAMATLVSTQFGPPPWNLGTGASQAVMAITGAGLWLRWSGVDRSKRLLFPLVFSIAMALTLDLIHAHYPKPGHVSGLMLGFLIAWCLRRKTHGQGVTASG
jgi:rhomboid protease GluP